MKVNRVDMRKYIEFLISNAIVEGEEADVTTEKIMNYLNHLIIIAERYDPKTNKD